MSTKEFHLFVVDLSPSMAEASGGRSESDLEYGLKMFYEYAGGALLKQRKQDRVGLVLCHSRETRNPHANETSLRNIEVVFENSEYTYGALRVARAKLEPNVEPVRDSEGDCFEALLVAIGVFKDTARLKFNRRISVITNGRTPVASFGSDITRGIVEVIRNMDIQITVNGVDFGGDRLQKPSLKWGVEKEWERLMAMYNGRVENVSTINKSLLYSPPLRRVRPIAVFTGELRFGYDYRNLHANGESSSGDDESSIKINVQSYPAVKQEKLPAGHQYVVNGRAVDRVKNHVSYYIHEEESQGSQTESTTSKQIPVEKGDWQPQFKYSNIDPPIPLESDLLEVSTLKSSAGLDILGCIKRAKLPYAYSTGESLYVVPSSSALKKDYLMFNCICKVLLDLEALALCRYVPKDGKEIQICCLKPTKFRVKESTITGLVLQRIALKEDEQVGRFPPLTKMRQEPPATNHNDNEEVEIKEETTTDENIYPDEKICNDMDRFILKRDLDSGASSEYPKYPIVDNPKVIADPQITPTDDRNAGYDILNSSSPALHKFSKNLKKIIEHSLGYQDLHECLHDDSLLGTKMNRNDTDSNEYLSGMESTNLFNLTNVLSINSSKSQNYVQKKELEGKQIAKRLIQDLGIKYIKRSEVKRQRKNDGDPTTRDVLGNGQPNNHTLEGIFDKALDTDDLLNPK